MSSANEKENRVFIIIIAAFAVLCSGIACVPSPHIAETTPTDEIWRDYETLKYETSPTGRAERVQREAEEAERQRQAAIARAEAERLERERREAERRAAEEERQRKEAAAKADADRQERLRKEAEEKRIDEERRTAEARRIAEERRIAEDSSLLSEVRRSGFNGRSNMMNFVGNDVKQFVRYGNSGLYNRLLSARGHSDMRDPFKKEEGEARIRAIETEIATAQAAIAQKTFSFQTSYNTRNVNVYGNESSCEIFFQIPIDRPVMSRQSPSFPASSVITDVSVTEDGAAHARVIKIAITGSTDSIEELVRNHNNYRARVWIRNLRPTGSYNNITADVQRIEIIKVQ